MDARVGSGFEGSGRTLDIRRSTAGERGDLGAADRLGHQADGLEITFRSNGEPSLDHVHTQAVELLRHAELFLHIHAATGGLLAVTKRGVENRDLWLFNRRFHARRFLSV